MARFLQIEPSFLSKILNRKRRATPAIIIRISERLGISDVQSSVWLNRDLEANFKAAGVYKTLTVDQFSLIAEWYHYAILELIKIKRFKPQAKSVAKALGISVTEAHAAVERLERLNLLARTRSGKWVNVRGSNTTVGSASTASAFRQLQKSILQKAVQALEDFPVEIRDQSSMTFAIDSRFLPEAKKHIQNFRRSITELLQKSENFDQVYQLSISLFPATQRNKNDK